MKFNNAFVKFDTFADIKTFLWLLASAFPCIAHKNFSLQADIGRHVMPIMPYNIIPKEAFISITEYEKDFKP